MGVRIGLTAHGFALRDTGGGIHGDYYRTLLIVKGFVEGLPSAEEVSSLVA